jgi:transposase
MPTAQEILDSFIGINGFTTENDGTEFKRGIMTAVIGIRPLDRHRAVCDGCGQVVTGIKDREERRYRDKPVFDWKVYLKVDRRRVNCPRCGVRSERFSFVDGRSRFTRRFERMVFEDSMDQTIAAAAKKHGVSWHQAARIEYSMLERYDRYRGPLRAIRWLGVDEICFGRMNNMYTIVSDLERGAVIGVADGHQTSSLDAFFKAAGTPFCQSIRIVCMDMWKAYRASVTTFCGNAKIIFDKFHLIRHLNDALDEIRRREFFRQGGEKRDLVRGKRWLFLRRWFNLTTEQKGLLKETLALNKRLSVAYYLKEIFGSLWLYSKRAWALKFLDRWQEQLKWQRLKPLEKFMDMVRKHLDGILNYCEEKIPLGRVEAINGVIKSIIRKARGFRNHRHGALKIMFLTDSMAYDTLNRSFHT